MIAALMNNISMHFTDTKHIFDNVVMDGTGTHLIFYLKAALERFDEEKRTEFARYGLL